VSTSLLDASDEHRRVRARIGTSERAPPRSPRHEWAPSDTWLTQPLERRSWRRRSRSTTSRPTSRAPESSSMEPGYPVTSRASSSVRSQHTLPAGECRDGPKENEQLPVRFQPESAFTQIGMGASAVELGWVFGTISATGSSVRRKSRFGAESIVPQSIPSICSRRNAGGNQTCRDADNCHDGEHACQDCWVPGSHPE
jgi:hypothetical protein